MSVKKSSRKAVLSEKYQKQKTFGYWLLKKWSDTYKSEMYSEASSLELLRHSRTVAEQREFYEEFEASYKELSGKLKKMKPEPEEEQVPPKTEKPKRVRKQKTETALGIPETPSELFTPHDTTTDQDDDILTTEFELNGRIFLIDPDDNLYHFQTHQSLGKFDRTNNRIIDL